MKLLYTKEKIMDEISRVGQEISLDYKDKEVMMVGILKGCLVFMAHLMVNVSSDVTIDFMTVSSYKDGTESGDLHLIKDLDQPVEGKDVLIVEDIIDTGKTLAFVRDYLYKKGANSVEIVTFVNKQQRRAVKNLFPRYKCFEYDGADFLVGFGFDYAEKFRNLPYVYTIDAQNPEKSLG